MSSLEITTPGDARDAAQQNNSSSIEEQYQNERERAKLRHWKEGEYAAGLVEPTWADELEMSRRRGGCCGCCKKEELGQIFQEEIDPGCGCNYLSAVVCSRFGAARIGNMIVLKERYVMVEEEVDDDDDNDEGQERVDGFVDEEEGGTSLHLRNSSGGGSGAGNSKSIDKEGNDTTKKGKKRHVRKRELQLVVGPFWPMLLFITYPLIFGVSALTLYAGIPGKPIYIQLGWALLTALLIRSLFNTGFRDPGILMRHKDPPPINNDDLEDEPRRRIGFCWGNEEGPWRWSDQAHSYRPKNSMFCPDCKVIIEEFDHT